MSSMSQPYLISIDYLRAGAIQKFTMVLAPDFLEINEPELRFCEEVSVTGEAYLVEENLILHFDAKTGIEMPCSICNQKTFMTLSIKGVYHTVSLEKYFAATFDLRPALREELLIELPRTIECQGNCPERSCISSFMQAKEKDKNYFPFSSLGDR